MKSIIAGGITLLAIVFIFTGCRNQDNSKENTEEKLSEADSLVLSTAQLLGQDSSEINFIWYGRRLGYVNQMDEAIQIFSLGISKYNDSWKLYRFRGHRYISTRDFNAAIRDLDKAASLMKNTALELEPDGIPNKINKPLSTYQFNVWYHLGLAYYLTGNLKDAEVAFKNCLNLSDNDDLLVASADWLYMIYRQQNNKSAAEDILNRIHDNMSIIENESYYLRLKMYKGILQPESLLHSDTTASDYDLSIATQGYGVANWYYYNGNKPKAKEILQKVTSGKSTYSFGYIAAETMLTKQF
jgi:tetratricopeptide (TPR) repeat protein